MSSSSVSGPASPVCAPHIAARSKRKRADEAGSGGLPGGTDTLLRRAKQRRTLSQHDAPASLPGPSLVRWPELYVDSIPASEACDRALVRTGRLHPDNIGSVIPGRGNRIGVVLGLHGLSAGPWQFADLAQAYAGLGLDVYTPRMVGHGLRAGGLPDPHSMPDLDDEGVYVRYARVVFDNARSYARSQNLPLLFSAHSAGAVLAGILVQEHARDIAGQVYIHPLHAPTSWAARFKFWVARMIRPTSFGRWWLRRAQHVFVKDADGRWPGYPTMPFAKIFPVLNLARKVWRSFVTTSVPTMLFVSDCDRTCDPAPTIKTAHMFFKNVTIHHFGRNEGVGHAAVSAIENPRADIRQTLYDKSGAFLADCARKAGRPCPTPLKTPN